MKQSLPPTRSTSSGTSRALKRRSPRAAGAALAAAAAGAVLASCQFVAGLTGNYLAATGGHDGGQGGHDGGQGGQGGATTSSSAGTGGEAACESAWYPDPPASADSGDITFVAALRTINLGDMGQIPGLDLDHTCTCCACAGSTEPSCAPSSAQPQCDAPGGVDNAAVALIGMLATTVGESWTSHGFSQTAEKGLATMLVRVSGYNGTLDDPSVQVAFFHSRGIVGGGAQVAKWDGSDAWGVSSTALGPGGLSEPKFVSQNAYVTQGVLVAGVPVLGIPLFNTSQVLELTPAIVTATIISKGGGYALTNGTGAGRVTEATLFHMLSGIRDAASKPICTDMFGYTAAKNSLCAARDVKQDASLPKSVPCDAISFGIGFTADPASLGPVVAPIAESPGCPPATDPQYDSCP